MQTLLSAREPTSTMGVYRKKVKKRSNNSHNPNQNICCQRVCRELGVAHEVRYLHNASDVLRAVRLRYSVRSVKSKSKAGTVGATRKNLQAIGAQAYIVEVKGHILLLDGDGLIRIDTDPRKRDKRKILGIWGVYPK